MSTMRGEALWPSAHFESPDGLQTELWALDLSSCADAKERVEQKPLISRGKIAAMLREQVLVEEGGEIRPCRASDFCILLRSPKGRAEVYRDALSAPE